jgi:hypothetical protein
MQNVDSWICKNKTEINMLAEDFKAVKLSLVEDAQVLLALVHH